MDPYQSSALLLTAIIAYIIIVDKNVGDYITLIFKLMRVNIERFFWMIRFHPRNPITNFLKEREYAKLAKELEKELMKND
jgi:hypothetical protein